MKDTWVVDDDLCTLRKEDDQFSVPWIVSSIFTDGLHMQVVPATIVKNVHSDEASCTEPSPPSAVKGPLPSGVAELVRKKVRHEWAFRYTGALKRAVEGRGSYRC